MARTHRNPRRARRAVALAGAIALLLGVSCARSGPVAAESDADASAEATPVQAAQTQAQPDPAPLAPCSMEAWAEGGPAASMTHCDPMAVSLAEALNAQLTVWTRPDGSRIHAEHCRLVRGGCRQRIAAFASMLTEAATNEGLDPFLLAAVAVHESGLSPNVVGPRGSAGILQLNPRGVGAGLRVVRDPAYRAWCARHRVGACQDEVIARGARHLAQWIGQCDGDVAAALGGYNTGECGANAYTRRVLRMYDELEKLADQAAANAASS